MSSANNSDEEGRHAGTHCRLQVRYTVKRSGVLGRRRTKGHHVTPTPEPVDISSIDLKSLVLFLRGALGL